MNYNSWIDKKPFGAVKICEEVEITCESDFEKVFLILFKGYDEIFKTEMKKDDNDFTCKFKIDNEGVYNYHFEGVSNYQTFIFGKNEEDGSIKTFNYDYINKYQITVYKDFTVPTWYKEGILYNIFVDRFNNGNKNNKVDNPKKNSFIYANWNDEPMYIKDDKGDILRWDFFGGNLKGVTEKLTYLSRLGVKTIYLNPIFEARSNHKYDTANYKNIDPMFGDENILKDLIEKADKKGIKIILDGVFSHTGADSIYFNRFSNYENRGAFNSRESKYFDWFKFEEYPNKYESWWGIYDLPNVNENNESYKNYIIHDKDSVLNKWINIGIKGFRLDVCDELPTSFLREFKKKLKEVDNDSVLVGEVWEDASNKVSYSETRSYLQGEELDSIMGYPFRKNMVDFMKKNISSNQLTNRFVTMKENYPSEAFKSNLNILSSHDTTRILTELNHDKDLVKLSVLTQMTFEGVPYIYYGDEAGVDGTADPLNRKTYPWKNEDLDMFDFYKKATSLRTKNDVLKYGETEFLYSIDDDIFGFVRTYQNEKLLVIINRFEKNKKIKSNNFKYVNAKLGKLEVGFDIDKKSYKILKMN